ncbi:hypothetical protein RND81_05G177000 [Saponaria officinalis]|uniref:Uncharacterized protein n=1 Tax=Saponaria officinalis TaxID=3572 RepID=A0AAW1KTP7_SAPOF
MTTTQIPRKPQASSPKKGNSRNPFKTTDFDEMDQLSNTQINKNLNEAEFQALLQICRSLRGIIIKHIL